MAAVEDRNYIVGCLALLLMAGGLYYLASDPRAGERRDRQAALREECIRTGKAAFHARHRATGMTREQAGDLVGRCFSDARRNSN
ncbi:MAG TPA: hypothetical protein VMS43_09320 [Allosphingosinicella sp.]|nr:hypothetical protein [Allosphingosinicella sp.]